MKVNFYLIVNDKGTTKTCKNKPGLNWNEVAIAVNMELPNTLFQKPQLSAKIVVPDEAAVQQAIEATTADNVRQAIEQVPTPRAMFNWYITEPDENLGRCKRADGCESEIKRDVPVEEVMDTVLDALGALLSDPV